ncbi:MAG: transposase, partial [candidate division WOR-3 bacterium]
DCLLKDKDVLTAYFNFPKEHWRHIKTSNPVESSFAWIRARLSKAKRLRSEKSALGLVFQLMLRLESAWFHLSYPELIAKIVYYQKQVDGTLKEEKKYA